MAIHEAVLDAALRICRERGGWTFRPGEIVDALPGLNAASVRTHVMSRCCTNAPPHHSHRWPYFRRLRRGVYQVRLPWRERRRESAVAGTTAVTDAAGRKSRPSGEPRPLLVVEVRESGGEYVAEIGRRSHWRTERAGSSPARAAARIIRAPSLDGLVSGLGQSLRESTGQGQEPTLPIRLMVDLEPERPDPVIAAYAKDIDRTLIRANLLMSHEERLQALQGWANDIEEIRGAAARREERGEP